LSRHNLWGFWMTSQSLPLSIIIDDRAEGSPEPRETHEDVRATQTVTPVMLVAPASLTTGTTHSPAAETGIVAAISVEAEGTDDSDRQDASRTTAETRLIPDPAQEGNNPRLPTALIVEDAPEIAEILKIMLERMGLKVAHEARGNKALARVEEMDPDVILLDIGLPDMTGWAVLEAIKARQGARMPIVIVITAYGDAANRLVGKLHGVDNYLVKPFTSDEVEQVILQALGGSVG
jgi:CheY-like chemotaxis protein